MIVEYRYTSGLTYLRAKGVVEPTYSMEFDKYIYRTGLSASSEGNGEFEFSLTK